VKSRHDDGEAEAASRDGFDGGCQTMLDLARDVTKAWEKDVDSRDNSEVQANLRKLGACVSGLQHSLARLAANLSPVLRTPVQAWKMEPEDTQEPAQRQCEISESVTGWADVIQEMEKFVNYLIAEVSV
jgi:hypothetical protein